MIRLQNKIKNFTNILHIGDIHIRLVQRHEEYKEAFEKLYKAVEKTPDTTLVLVAGDIFHNKSDLSPESVKLASDFLKNLADRRSTILIAGNHDATLANKNRLDSLSPIVDALKHENLYYLKDSEVYIIGDVLFNNYSVFDEPNKYIKYADIPSIYRNEINYSIALYHGPVNNAVTDIGYVVSNRNVMVETFDGHQMVMLGDIHKHQVLQEYNSDDDKPVIVYCGSIIQQDHGEDLKGHGFVYWDLKSKKFKHFEIPNDYGFFTVEVNKGKLNTNIKTIPKKAKLRIKCIESVQSEIKSVLNEIRKESEITDVSYVRIEDEKDDKNIIDATDFNLQNVTDVDYQNELIKKYLENKNIKVTEDTLNCIYSLNKDINNSLKKEYTPKNIRWKPKKFEFDNMFSYGEDNVIDFSKMNGVMGLFANNASGKSSILSALSFCLFDKCDRAFKASHILNSQKMTFKCKFNFEINGVDYFIERKANSDKKGTVKVDVKFWKLVDGNEVELNGEARRSTNDIIRDYIGDYDDFILTVLSIQNGKDGSFIDMGQTERKDLLAQFMGLNIFDKLSEHAVEKYRDVSVLLKNLSNKDYTLELNETEASIKNIENKIEEVTNQVDTIHQEKDANNNKLIELTKKLINIDADNVNIVSLENQKIKLTNDINDINKQINQLKLELGQNEKLIVDTDFNITKFENKKLKENLDNYEKYKKELSKLESTIEKKKVVIQNKLDKLSKLEEHKYDPNCPFCINNVFVKDAIKTKEELIQDKNDAATLMNSYKALKQNIADLDWVVSDNESYTKFKNDKNSYEKTVSRIKTSLAQADNQLNQNTTKLQTVTENIEKFYQQKENIENNEKVNKEIAVVKGNIKQLESDYKSKNNQLIDLNGDLRTADNQKKQIQDNIVKLKELESVNDCYKYYIQAVSRDGIPYDLITQALPVIEKEVNEILHQIVEFTISLKTDGKNISTYIAYDNKKWPLELGSGMEKFISSLAIRVALINISNLPRPNFIIFDEGWGTLDSNHISEVKLLFDFLKNHFDFVLIISHIDSIKDLVDNLLEITKNSGFSQIKYI
jgi:DNA repair exonuclease SbcCD ATPase subunit